MRTTVTALPNYRRRETRLSAPRPPLPQGKEEDAGGGGEELRRDGADSERLGAGGGRGGSQQHLAQLLGPFPGHASRNHHLCGNRQRSRGFAVGS